MSASPIPNMSTSQYGEQEGHIWLLISLEVWRLAITVEAVKLKRHWVNVLWVALLQVVYSYSIGFVYILLGQIVTGQLVPAFQFCMQVIHRSYSSKYLCKDKFLCITVSSTQDCSKCFTCYCKFTPWQTCSIKHRLDCPGKYPSRL